MPLALKKNVPKNKDVIARIRRKLRHAKQNTQKNDPLRLRVLPTLPAMRKKIHQAVVPAKHDSPLTIVSKAVIWLLILALVLWAGRYLYKKLKPKPKAKELLDHAVKADQPLIIKHNNIPRSEYGNEYTLSYWIYINDWEFKNKLPKSVMYRGDKGAVATTPGFWFYPENNRLKVAFQLQSFQPTLTEIQLLQSCPNSMNPIDNPNFLKDHKGTCDIDNIPLQRWNNICVSIWNQSVDVYLNGKLVRSCVMHEYPVPGAGDIHIGHNGGFNGLVSAVQYHPTILTPEEIYKIYTDGPELKKKDVEVQDGAVVA